MATHFILLSSAATSSATSEYVTVLEQPNREEEPTIKNEEQTRNVPSFYRIQPQNLSSDIICILPVLEQEILSYLAYLF